MFLGLIFAEKCEGKSLIKSLKTKIIEFNGLRFYLGKYGNNHIVICFSGVGKTNASMCAMNLIINFNVNKILNIGACGTYKKDILPKSILLANNLQYYDIDLSALGYSLNQLPDQIIDYQTKKQNINYLTKILANEQIIIGTIATGDNFINLDNIEKFPVLGEKNIIGYDMEACAIAQVCIKTKVDFICLKIVTDNLCLKKPSKQQYQENLLWLEKKIEEIAIKIFSSLDSLNF